MSSDEWEKRLTREVAFNVAGLRALHGWTIEQFASECDRVVGEPGRFKANTLQALFAGKRKSVTLAELIVFASALHVPLAALLLPFGAGRSLPLPDGRELGVVDVWNRITGEVARDGEDAVARVWQQQIEELADYVRELNELRTNIITARYLRPDPDGNVRLKADPQLLLAEVRGGLKVVQSYLRRNPDWRRDGDPLFDVIEVLGPQKLDLDSLLQASDSLASRYFSTDPAEHGSP